MRARTRLPGGNLTGPATIHLSGYTVNSSTVITATMPAEGIAGTYHVQIVGAGGTSSDTTADHFAYGIPTVTSLGSPALPIPRPSRKTARIRERV